MSTTFRLNNSTLSNCILFCFLEEYTKISTPRQEVLFKKGSIGAKKKLSTTTSAPPVGSSVHADSEQDSLNGNAASPVSPSQGDSADPFQYSGKSQSFSFSNEGKKQSGGFRSFSGCPLSRPLISRTHLFSSSSSYPNWQLVFAHRTWTTPTSCSWSLSLERERDNKRRDEKLISMIRRSPFLIFLCVC